MCSLNRSWKLAFAINNGALQTDCQEILMAHKDTHADRGSHAYVSLHCLHFVKFSVLYLTVGTWTVIYALWDLLLALFDTTICPTEKLFSLEDCQPPLRIFMMVNQSRYFDYIVS